RSAHYRHAFPHAAQSLAWFGRGLEVEQNIVGDEKIELAIAVVIEKSATCSPRLAIARNSGRCCNFFEGSIAFVVVEAIFSVVSHVEVVVAVVVVIPHTHALAPTAKLQSG